MTHFLRFNHHTQREGEQDVEEHNNHDGDRDPHHELLVLRHLVLEGGVAAFEVEGVILRGVGGANLRAASVHLSGACYFNSIFLPFTATLNTHKYDYLGSLICEMFVSNIYIIHTAGLLYLVPSELDAQLKLGPLSCQSLKLSTPQHFSWNYMD